MPDDLTPTPEEFTKTNDKSKRSNKPIIIGIVSVAVVAVLFFVGKTFLFKSHESPEHETAEVHEEESHDELPLPFNNDTAGLSALLFDSLELTGDGIMDLNDSVDLPIMEMTGDQIDSSEYVEIPGVDYLDDSQLLNAIVSADEFVVDSLADFELALATSMNPEFDLPQLSYQVARPDTFRPQVIDTAAIIAALKPQIVGESKSQIDSLKAVAFTKEQALQLLATDNQELTSKLSRYKPKIDSTRAVQVKRLAKIIDTMSPSAAANMLSAQGTDEIIEILMRVKPRKAAQILQQLPPNIASDVTVKVVR